MKTPPQTLGVDFDGVIHAYSRGWHDGTIYDQPRDGAVAAVRKLMGLFAVFVHTSRNPEQVADWLNANAMPATTRARLREEGNPAGDFWHGRGVLLVTSHKYPAQMYVDDRAHHFTDWNRALRAIYAHTNTPPPSRGGTHRRFTLVRDVDPSGVSGTGMVTEGVEFSDGTVALRWLPPARSTAVFEDLPTALIAHGHNGLTRVEWEDHPQQEE